MPILSIFGLHASVQSFLFGSVRKKVDAALFMVNGFRKKYCFFVSIHAPVRVRLFVVVACTPYFVPYLYTFAVCSIILV